MQGRFRKGGCFLGCVLALAASWTSAARAQNADTKPVDLEKLKAAFVLNFARYAVWPEDAFADARSPLVVGVIGDDELAAYLETLSANETVNGRGIEVERVDADTLLDQIARDEDDPARPRPLRLPHLVFIGAGARNEARGLIAGLATRDVLTVSDLDGFAEQGGMIGLVLRSRRLAFDANVDRISASRVSISSQVLRLARLVNTGSS